MNTQPWQSIVKANSAVPHHIHVFSLSQYLYSLFSSAMHAKPWHSAEPLQSSHLEYERSLFVLVRTKSKFIAKLLTFNISFPSLSFCTFGVFSWKAAMGAAIRALLYVCSSGISPRDAERRRGEGLSCAQPFHSFDHVFVHWHFPF